MSSNEIEPMKVAERSNTFGSFEAPPFLLPKRVDDVGKRRFPLFLTAIAFGDGGRRNDSGERDPSLRSG